MTTNVGIKEEQKKQISLLLESKKGKYNSINEFVQRGIDLLISTEKAEESKSSNKTEKNTIEIQSFVEKILQKELKDEITISEEIAECIQQILGHIKDFKFQNTYGQKPQILVSAIRLKDSLNNLKEKISNHRKENPKQIPEDYIEAINKLKKKFVEELES